MQYINKNDFIHRTLRIYYELKNQPTAKTYNVTFILVVLLALVTFIEENFSETLEGDKLGASLQRYLNNDFDVNLNSLVNYDSRTSKAKKNVIKVFRNALAHHNRKTSENLRGKDLLLSYLITNVFLNIEITIDRKVVYNQTKALSVGDLNSIIDDIGKIFGSNHI